MNLWEAFRSDAGNGTNTPPNTMYQYIDGNLAISVNDWCEAGLTYSQFLNDSHRGYLSIAQRSQRGETLIWVDSIKRKERLAAIEAVLGKAQKERMEDDIYAVSISAEARQYYSQYVKSDGTRLTAEQIDRLTRKASLFEVLQRGLHRQQQARMKHGTRMKMAEWYKTMMEWWARQTVTEIGLGIQPYQNVRSFERAFKAFQNDKYDSLIHGGMGRENARIVSKDMANLLLALWRTEDKPFIDRVYELYKQFITGSQEIYDRQTGEVFDPKMFYKNGKPQMLSRSTVWNYLKDVVNETAVYADRNGHFDFQNSRRPKHHRHLGEYSLSKISMDDVALSRKAIYKGKQAWVYKYIAVDVVSGYYFRPDYIIGKPNERTVYNSFRNMFCELLSLGLPMPAELEVEHHLMSNIPWLDDVFKFVRFCQSPTEKRAEHNIRSLKWGTSKDMGHMRGRWYAKSEAYRSIRNKVDGDYTEPTFDAMMIIQDDLADIERHNNELHPNQKLFPGMTRKQVLVKCVNPTLKPLDMSYLLQFIGNITETSIRNNDYCAVNNSEYEIRDFNCLDRLAPNNKHVTAYWLPDENGEVNEVYLYQGDTFIGIAENRAKYAYNECAAERTDDDKDKMLHQQKRAAKFDKFVKERRASIPQIGRTDSATAQIIAATETEIVENEQPLNYEQDEFNSDTEILAQDYAKMALNNL